MTSKIINMAEHMKDEQDRMLDAMFASDPIDDDGFSRTVMRRVRRKILIRRLTLPIAALVGGLVAFKPVSALFGIVLQLLQQLPDEYVSATVASLPTLQTIVTGALLLFVGVLSLGMLED